MACHLLLSVLSSVAFFPSAAEQQGFFEPQCQSEDDYGWPRFKSQEELAGSPWASYFMIVYGELPSKYPVCIYDFSYLDSTALIESNITLPKAVPPNEVQEGDLFGSGMPGGGWGIYHQRWKPLPHNAWVEIAHTAFPSEVDGYWVFRTRGSGIWKNIGKTKVFPTPADPTKVHQEAIAFLKSNCSRQPSSWWPQVESDIFGFCAREKGFDSIQFQPQEGEKPTGSFGITGTTEIVFTNIDGKYNCGVEEASKTPLHEGWLASRQCSCTNYKMSDSCGMMADAPPPYRQVGPSPRLCKKQEGPPFWNRWKSCDPSTCKQTRCNAQPHRYIFAGKPADETDNAIVVV